MSRVSAIQLVSGPDYKANLATISAQIAALPVAENHLVVLPECCLIFGCSDAKVLNQAEPEGMGSMQDALAQLAKQYGIWLVAGTIPLRSDDESKFTASSLCFAPDGSQIAHYQKIHLFDVNVADNTGRYRESARTQAGSKVVVADLGFAKVGMSVCYDIRFPELYRKLGEGHAQILVLPAAFTEKTGKAHWHALLRARAIENQCYLVAAAQGGTHENGRMTYGHSMIVSPWGDIIDEMELGPGAVSAEIDMTLLSKIRQDMPVWQHRQF